MRAAALFLALSQAGAAHFPLFSWETLPVFFHSSVLNSLTWNSSDLSIITRFPVVTIEKWQGCNSTVGCYVPGPQSASESASAESAGLSCPTQQDAALATAKLLKQMRPNISVAIWFDSLRIYSQRNYNPDILDIEWQSCVRNAVTPFLETHGDYLLKNSSGKYAEEAYLKAHVYDHTQEYVREFWKQACLNMTSTGYIDGCGADASQQPGSYITGLAPSVAAAWTEGHIQAVGNATEAVSAQGGFVLGKLENQLGVSTNGVLQEGCTAGNATITTLRAAAAAAKAANTRYIYECHTNGTPDDMAAFLIGAGEDQYFGFGTWVSPSGGVGYAWLPEFENALGAPTADAEYDASAQVWSRAFASGTKVTFDLKTNKGTISWGKQ
jgi:hypothetical protein